MAKRISVRPRSLSFDNESDFLDAALGIEQILKEGAEENILALARGAKIVTYESKEGMVAVCDQRNDRRELRYILQFPDDHPKYSEVRKYLDNSPYRHRLIVTPESDT